MLEERGIVNDKRSEKRLKLIDYIYQYLLIGVKPEEQFEDHEISNEHYETLKIIIENEVMLIESINNSLSNDWNFKRLGYIEKAVLLYAHYEILIKKRDKALIIDESVKIIKYYTIEDEYKYINKSLDNLK